MASEKKPSIYDDRGTIGSADELDEYGVWVKSEPQDLSAVSAPETGNIPEASSFSEDSGFADDLDMGIPEIEDLPDFDADNESELHISTEDLDMPVMEDDGGSAFDMEDFSIPEDDSGAPETPQAEESLKIEEFSADSESDNAGFTEVSMDDFIGNLETEPESTAVEELALISEDREAEKKPAQDLSTQLLMKIADELSSIRSELSLLKKEFSGLKAAASQEDAGSEAGFFGEEDDEKIALTGDELNNILNTADFTEEAGADATVDLSDDLSIEEAVDSPDDSLSESSDPFSGDQGISEELGISETDGGALDLDISLDDADLDELGGETKLDDGLWADQSAPDLSSSLDISIEEESAAEDDDILRISDLDSALDSVDLEASGGDELPEFTIDESEELNHLRENGAEPTTFAPAPEDTDYLTSDPLAGDSEDLGTEESIDLSEAVIDEPDLSSEIHDNPLEEPSLEDISISLDLSDLGSDELSSDELGSNELGSDELGSDELISEEPGVMELSAEDIESIEMGPEDQSFDESISMGGIDEAETEEIPVSSDPGTDLSLIPEGFVVDSEESPDTLEMPEFADSGEPAEAAEKVSEESADSFEMVDLPQDEELQSEDISFNIPEEDLGISEEETAAEGLEIKDFPAEEETAAGQASVSIGKIPGNLKQELKTVLTYMDQLLEALPDDKIEEFAKSEYFDTYKKLFKELGLV